MEFYRVEYLMENWKDSNEKEQKHRKDEEDKQAAQYNPSAMQRQQGSMMQKYMGQNNMPKFGGSSMSMPKMPNMGSMKF